MLLFNLNSAAVTALAAIISIHLMLLFNGLFPGLPIHILLNFNTSNVTIQLPTGHKPCVFYLISIHLMLLFNREKMKCGFGIHNFNTSNVTIQHIRCNLKIIFNIHFNTSNVTIQQGCEFNVTNFYEFQYI